MFRKKVIFVKSVSDTVFLRGNVVHINIFLAFVKATYKRINLNTNK